ncbi:hypothetical protein DFH29DRAFT_1000020 [Suillus ampliporus]|nr:hypothetical protein DFH29DRAFT_1000020 [Suillus ampliporus]
MPENISRTHAPRQVFGAFQVPCGHAGCNRFFKTTAGRTKHVLSAHPIVSLRPLSPDAQSNDLTSAVDADAFLDADDLPVQMNSAWPNEELRASPPPNVHAEFFRSGNLLYCNYHPLLDGHSCDEHGNFLTNDAPPSPPELKSRDDWTPFRNRVEFEMAELLYIKNQMPAGQADRLLDLWATTLLKHGDIPPFADHKDLYATIDSIPLGDVKWVGFSCTYTAEKPDGNYPPWMDGSYDVWYQDPQEVVQNMLVNPAYSDEMDY